jgi:hypothetical protein
MRQLDNYNKAQQELFDYFGYVENWVSIPVEDSREYFWTLYGEGPGHVEFAATSADLLNKDEGNYHEEEIYTQRFLPKWVYRGEEYTMISVLGSTDGNKFLRIFSNSREMLPSQNS